MITTAQTMWLINVHTLQIPEYAIVSHRWRDDELSLRQYEGMMSDSEERHRLRTIVASKSAQDISDPESDS
jgi:hypothetical protein